MTLVLLGLAMLHAMDLPMGSAPDPVPFPHFPDRLHAFVWFNWPLVPAERMAQVVGAEPGQIVELGRRMGLPKPPVITDGQWRRSYITVIRRNWHLLPYEQMLTLLDWTPEQLAFTLREDDFLFIKLGNLKPRCETLRYEAPDEAARAREDAIAAVIDEAFPKGLGGASDPLFGFVKRLSELPAEASAPAASRFSPRFCSSYFMLYGDPFLETECDPYPEGYLARLAQTGVDGVWLQAVLYKMAPFPWEPQKSARYEERLANLGRLVARAKKQGIGIYLYLNEPRAMPLDFFEAHPELKGVTEGDHAVMCTSVPAVQDYLRDSVAGICTAVPDLAGFFTITASENLTNCWSHGQGAKCARCKERGAAAVIAEVNALVRAGIAQSGSDARLLAWDWGWGDSWAAQAIAQLPADVALMSVSEWSIPFTRGGVDSVVGEYSISVVGPGPRATRHWGLAQARGLKTIAKVQAGNTWELSSVPYIPALENVARHAANLLQTDVNGMMLGWTLGGYPSPNLEVFAEMGRGGDRSVDGVLEEVATRRFGAAHAAAVVTAWRAFSVAFSEFPYHPGGLYSGPQQMGPANPLWERPTGYRSTMVCFPYDGLDQWRAVFPRKVYADQFTKIAEGFEAAIAELKQAAQKLPGKPAQAAALAQEMDVAGACAIHFRSVANQAQFVIARDRLADLEAGAEAADVLLDGLVRVLRSEIDLATRLYALQSRDSRFGFEASNHYFYVPIDLAAKVINCRDLLDRWLPSERARLAK